MGTDTNNSGAKPSDPQPNTDLKQTAVQQAKKRMFWKLVIILVCLLAYILLEAIETAKESYDKAQNTPIVIVSEEYVADQVNKSDNDKAVLLAKELGSTTCPELPTKKPEVKGKQYNATLLRLCAVQGLIDNPDVKETLRKKLMYQNFSNGAEIIGRLDAEVRAEAELAKKALLSTEEVENRVWARKIPDLDTEKTWIYQALKNRPYTSELPQTATPEKIKDWIDKEYDRIPEDKRHASEDEITSWRATLSRMRYSTTVPLELRELLVLHKVIVEEKEIYETRVKSLNDVIGPIDDKVQSGIAAIHERLKPKLPKLIAGSPGAPRDYAQTKLGWFSFDPRPLLDAKNGIHLVYQIFRLALVMIVGLGLIALIVFLIRLVPPISRGTDQFSDKASEFFRRSDGGGPQLARSLLMTASAVGIGAAVVVGSSAVGLRAVAADISYAATQDGQAGNGKQGPKGESGSGDKDGSSGSGSPGAPGLPGESKPNVDLHQVELLPPIVYPSPITVSGPSSVELNLDWLEPYIQQMMDLSSKDLNSRISTIVENEFAKRNMNCPKPNDCCPPDLGPRIESLELWRKSFVPGSGPTANDLGPRIESLELWRKSFVSTPDPKLKDMADDLRATKEAVEKLQLENLERNQNSGGRGILTTATQFFKGDKYLVTTNTVGALRLLMRKPAQDCPDTIPPGNGGVKQKCCAGTIANNSYCPNANVEALLERLLSMVGEPPRSESEFMKRLRAPDEHRISVDKATIDQWKSVILKYARRAY